MSVVCIWWYSDGRLLNRCRFGLMLMISVVLLLSVMYGEKCSNVSVIVCSVLVLCVGLCLMSCVFGVSVSMFLCFMFVCMFCWCVVVLVISMMFCLSIV